jgi:alkanesulfonate monooxygenase SsuD/methylene tetrahydromethanopterin reductase-like flavin-dependent oxidoreductase (luciferase family)
LRANGVAGTPDEVTERLRALGAAGAGTVYLQVLDLDDLDHLRLLSEGVLPHLA